MAIQRKQRRRTVLFTALIVTCAAASSAAGQSSVRTRTAGNQAADVRVGAPVMVAQAARSIGNRHPSSGRKRAAVTNPYALARRFGEGAGAAAAVSGRGEPKNTRPFTSPTRATNGPRKALHSSRPRSPVHTRGSVPSSMRGRDQLSIPGWPDELPF